MAIPPLILKSPAFSAIPVLHGFTTRVGGSSPAPYDSLNFSSSTGDSPEHVLENERRLLRHLTSENSPLVTMTQVHGDSVLVLGEDRTLGSSFIAGEYDALVTSRKDVIIGVKTADCTPILLYDSGSGVIASIHAGWRGTVKRIAARTVEVMSSVFGTRPDELMGVIGPCIGACCYSVGPEVTAEFEKVFGRGADLFRHDGKRNGKVFIDLQVANESVLRGAGLKEGNIHVMRLCTACNPELFFSYRRDGGKTGRHLNFIGRT